MSTLDNADDSLEQKIVLLSPGRESVSCMESCVTVNSIFEGLIRFDSRKRVIFSNDRVTELLGYTPNELRFKPIKWFFHNTKDKLNHRPISDVLHFANSDRKRGVTLETYLKSKSGLPIVVIFSINPVVNAEGVREYLATVVDIRSLRQAHEQTKNLLHAEKISVLGHLSASIAHEINNPLSFMLLDMGRQADMTRKLEALLTQISNEISPSERESLKKHLIELNDIACSTQEGLKRIADIVRSVKIFSRLDENPKKEISSLETILDAALRLVQTKTERRIKIVKYYDNKHITVAVNGGLLTQVALNLLINSIQAIGEEGTITVRTMGNGDIVSFEIEDTGCGIPEAVFPRLFTPYFTTKRDGTGLGLAIAKKIVEDMGGSIECFSVVNVGTKMKVQVPSVKDNSANRT